MTKGLIAMTNSDLFWEYNFIQANEFIKRAEFRAEIDRRFVDNELKFEILSHLPEHDSRRTARTAAYSLVSDLLAELDPELLWRVDTALGGGLSYLTVGEAMQMYSNAAKYGT